METKICKHCRTDIDKKAKVCPNCRKKQTGKFKIIAFVVILFIIFASALNDGETEDVASNSSVTEKASINSKDSSTVNTENKVTEEKEEKKDDIITFGDEGESNNLKVKINEVGEKTTISENAYLSYTPDSGKYGIINVSIKNTGKEAVTLSNSYFKLLTVDEAEYSPTFLIGLDNKYISFESINPGLDITGNLVFEIPSDLDITDMTLRFSGTSLFASPTKFSLKK